MNSKTVLIEQVGEWAKGVCELAAKEQRRGNYALLERIGRTPGFAQFYTNSFIREGTRLSPQLFAALHPAAFQQIAQIYESYYLEAIREKPEKLAAALVEDLPREMIKKLEVDELEGMAEYAAEQLRLHQEFKSKIASMSLERMQILIDKIQAEIESRKKEQK